MTSPSPVLDYVPRYDPRSLDGFRVSDHLQLSESTQSIWWTGGPVLNQGQEGACVGFGWAGEAAASPVRVARVTNDFARQWYVDAKGVDEWEGVDYDGTSVLAGAKVGRARGLYGSYLWAKTMAELDAALNEGPVVVGLPVYTTMFEPDANGFWRIGGQNEGGHCLFITGRSPNYLRRGKTYRLRQSWGRDHGVNGNVYALADDLESLIFQGQGEACLPVARSLPTP